MNSAEVCNGEIPNQQILQESPLWRSLLLYQAKLYFQTWLSTSGAILRNPVSIWSHWLGSRSEGGRMVGNPPSGSS